MATTRPGWRARASWTLAGVLLSSAAALAVDLTGQWKVHWVPSIPGPPAFNDFDVQIAQNGTQLDWTTSVMGAFTGTIDPSTGAFSLHGTGTDPLCGTVFQPTATGVATDVSHFAGTLTLKLRSPTFPCVPVFDDGPMTGVRVGPACGDGVVDPGEACDDGNGNGSDGCCSATCRVIDPDADGVCSASDDCPGVTDPAQDAPCTADLLLQRANVRPVGTPGNAQLSGRLAPGRAGALPTAITSMALRVGGVVRAAVPMPPCAAPRPDRLSCRSANGQTRVAISSGGRVPGWRFRVRMPVADPAPATSGPVELRLLDALDDPLWRGAVAACKAERNGALACRQP